MELNKASANSTLSDTPGQVPNDGTGTYSYPIAAAN
jgi:1,4-alpha-glucan branching enzyme